MINKYRYWGRFKSWLDGLYYTGESRELDRQSLSLPHDQKQVTVQLHLNSNANMLNTCLG